MSRTRVIFGIVIVIALAIAGFAGYTRYLAPEPQATPAPSTQPAEAAPAPSVVSAEGKIQPAREAKLAFRIGGRVGKVLVEQGQSVKAGDVLVELDAPDLQAALSQAEAAVELAKAQRDKALAGARPEEIAALEAQWKASQSAIGEAVGRRNEIAKGPGEDAIAAARAQLAAAQSVQKDAQIAYDKIIENIEYLAGPTEEKGRYALNAANQQLAAAQAALDQVLTGADPDLLASANSAISAASYQSKAADAQLALANAGPAKEDIAVADAAVKQAEAAVEAARAALTETQLIAPFDGVATDVTLDVGETAAPGVPAVTLADLAHWQMVTSDLAETDVVSIHPGLSATVTVDAFPGQNFPATVREISELAETNRGNVTYAVTLDLTATDLPLRWGMTAFVDIQVSSP